MAEIENSRFRDEAMLVAKSASDRTDDWPFWMVWNGQLNVTIPVMERLTGERIVSMPFLPRDLAEKAVEAANEAGITA